MKTFFFKFKKNKNGLCIFLNEWLNFNGFKPFTRGSIIYNHVESCVKLKAFICDNFKCHFDNNSKISMYMTGL